MRARIGGDWPIWSHVFHITPADIEHMTFAEIAAYRAAVKEWKTETAKAAKQRPNS